MKKLQNRCFLEKLNKYKTFSLHYSELIMMYKQECAQVYVVFRIIGTQQLYLVEILQYIIFIIIFTKSLYEKYLSRVRISIFLFFVCISIIYHLILRYELKLSSEYISIYTAIQTFEKRCTKYYSRMHQSTSV